MLIATWNVNSIRARVEHITKWVKDSAPDIILLQEIKCEEFPQIEALESYNIEYIGQKSYNGVAILSKFPIEDIICGLPNFEDNQARYIEVFTNNSRVASVYVPNGSEVGSDKYEYKLEFMKKLKSHMDNLANLSEPVVIGGDFNVATAKMDVYHGKLDDNKILCSKYERHHFNNLLHTGFYDITRSLHPNNDCLFSWWDYRAGSWDQNKGWRIDYLMANPKAMDNIIDSNIDTKPRGWQKPSDHTPVWCEIK